MITCLQCVNFERDKIGFGGGIGRCRPFEDWLNRYSLRRPKPLDYDKAFADLGSKVFYPKIERNCKKFVFLVDNKNNDINI